MASKRKRKALDRGDAVGLRDILSKLDKVAKGIPLAAFGQTPLWDEPMKAVVAASGRTMTAGIHDLDFFSRVRTPETGSDWRIVSRDDGAMKDPWIAAGELSAFFGAEVWPSRQRLTEAGVRLEQLMPKSGACRESALSRATAGWGWRGIVREVPDPSVIRDIHARHAAQPFLDLLRWGFRETRRRLVQAESRKEAGRLGRRIADTIKRFASAGGHAPLTAMLEELLRLMYRSLLGDCPDTLSFENAREFFRFNVRTAARPRFGVVESFLNPLWGDAARAAYDAAIANSGMVTLAETGGGALPFDVYHPCKGRGVLFLRSNRLVVGFTHSVTIRLDRPVETVGDLARILEDRLGSDLSLVGKAVVLPAMIGGECVMVLTETGSAYIPRTHRWLDAMRKAGIRLRKLHPLLRIRLETWSSLKACDLVFDLPEHLAQAFGKPRIDGKEFARRWRTAVRNQKRLIAKLARIQGPCELVSFLGAEKHELWFRKLEQCTKANARLIEIQRRVDRLRQEALSLRGREDEVRAEIKMLERERGTLNRSTIRPLKRRLEGNCGKVSVAECKKIRAEYEKAARRGKALLLSLESKQSERRDLQAKRKKLGGQMRAIERGKAATAARRLLHSVNMAAARERLKLARNAILAVEGLERANLRPAAWWMLAADPSGKWFEQIRKTARFYLEPL